MNEQKLINLKLRGKSLVTVLDTDIVYAEILNRKMNVFTVQGIMYEPVDIQLYELYEFIDTHQFIYINRSTIVNIQMIQSIHKPFLYLEGTERRFEISRRRYSEVRRAYRSLT
ncbi:MAG: LytTR family transcriptional regulator [Solobacterium sp.]|nr:LytTR family transcriptional regulator [Solobacterium sp.]